MIHADHTQNTHRIQIVHRLLCTCFELTCSILAWVGLNGSGIRIGQDVLTHAWRVKRLAPTPTPVKNRLSSDGILRTKLDVVVKNNAGFTAER